jgi:hypothetical protein
MLCTDEPSIVIEKERGTFRRLVEVKVDNEDLILELQRQRRARQPVCTDGLQYLFPYGREGAGGSWGFL